MGKSTNRNRFDDETFERGGFKLKNVREFGIDDDFYDTVDPKVRRAKIQWITSYFVFFCVLCLFDFSSDVFMMYTIQQDQLQMQAFYDDHLSQISVSDCAAVCSPCQNAVPPTQDACGFCDASDAYDAFVGNNSDQGAAVFKCDVPHFTNNFCDIKQQFENQLEELNNIWVAFLVLVCLSVFFTGYYFYRLYKKWKGKLSLVPLAHDGLIDPSTGLKIPYYAPPQEEWPGRVSAPTFVDPTEEAKKAKAKQAGKLDKNGERGNVRLLEMDEDVVVCPGCLERDRIGEVFCRTCGKKQGEIGLQGLDNSARREGKKKMAERQKQRQEQVRVYFSSFMSVAGTRMVMLMLEDMPQGLLAVLYVNTMDKRTGLQCVRSAFDYEPGDNLPEIGTSSNRVALWVLFAGQVASLILLMMQVLYIKGHQTKQQKEKKITVHESSTFCGTDALLLFVIIPGVMCPVLIALLVTDTDLVLGISDVNGSAGYTAFIVVVVITAVFALPWVGMFIFGCVALADVTGLDTFCTGACFPVDGDCCECCDCCDCCGCDSMGDICCCCDIC